MTLYGGIDGPAHPTAMKTREQAAAERGAALLDKRRPGWAARIDPDTLQMDSCVDCVLGQLGDGASPFLQQLRLLGLYDSDERFACGFAFADGATESADKKLTAAWRDEIAKRTKGGAQ